MTQESTAKKATQRLQRAIVEGLEDARAQDIQVFNTEHLSPLFERVIVASGTSNRQTKALAASVRDAVRDAGFSKPRIEGEENGEWIIVDCGAAVAHIMQPAIRTYYHLEDIWGEKPVRLKLGAPKPAAPAPSVKPAAAKAAPTSLRRSSAAKTASKAADDAARSPAAKKKAEAKKAARRAAAAKVAGKTPARAPAKAAVKSPVKTAAKTAPKSGAKAPAKPGAKSPARKTSAGTATRKA